MSQFRHIYMQIITVDDKWYPNLDRCSTRDLPKSAVIAAVIRFLFKLGGMISCLFRGLPYLLHLHDIIFDFF